MLLYKGYIQTKGKEAIQRFKDVPPLRLMTLEHAKKCESFAGVLSEETILIDIDTEEQAEIMMNIVEDHQLNCKVIQTGRGRHFLFSNNGVKKCGTDVRLACGLTADIKVGLANSYEVLKLDGEERFVEWDAEVEGEYDELPRWLTPVKTDVDFVSLGAGDGRNSALFGYILTLQGNGFKKEEAREAIRIINEYVLKDKLSVDELEVILRDDAFPAPESMFYQNNRFLHNNFARHLMTEHHIKRINGNLYYFEEYYRPLTKRSAFKLMQKVMPDIKQNQKAEVIGYIDSELDSDVATAGANFIGFRNGIYDLNSGILLENTPDLIVPNTIQHDYDPKAYSKTLDDSLNAWTCDDGELRSLLEECVGYTFLRDTRFQTAFILTGEKKNGKSTFLDTLVSLLGEDNVVSMDLKELDSNFKTNAIFGKLANIGDDISGKNIEDSSVFKKISSGERLTVDVKFCELMTFRLYAKLIFSTNEAPRIHDKTGAVGRRLVIIPFDATFEEADSGLRLKLKAEDSMNYLVQLGIKALDRLIRNDGFTKAKRAKKAKDEYSKYNDSVLGFVDDFTLDQVLQEDVGHVYSGYKTFCYDNGIEPESKIMFGKRLCKGFGLEKKQITVSGNKLYRYFKT